MFGTWASSRCKSAVPTPGTIGTTANKRVAINRIILLLGQAMVFLDCVFTPDVFPVRQTDLFKTFDRIEEFPTQETVSRVSKLL